MTYAFVSRNSLLMVLTALVLLFGCTKEPSELRLVTLSTGQVNLLSTPPTGEIPVNPVLRATFNDPLDLASAEGGTVKLIQRYNQEPIDIRVECSGSSLVIQPLEPLSSGAEYDLVVGNGLHSIYEKSLNHTQITFTTAGTFAPRGVVAWWDFNGDAEDRIAEYHPLGNGLLDVTFTPSRNDVALSAATFDGDRSIIEIPDASGLIDTHDFSLCFWVKTNSSGHIDQSGNPAGYYVMGLASYFGFQFEIASDFSWCNFTARYDVQGGIPVSEDLMFSGDGISCGNGGWRGWEYCRDITPDGGLPAILKDRWTHVVCAFNSATRCTSLYLNGELMKVINFNLWPDRDTRRNIYGLKYDAVSADVSGDLAFGFCYSGSSSVSSGSTNQHSYSNPGSNHFKGQLDDVRIYHKALTSDEIRMMFESEK